MFRFHSVARLRLPIFTIPLLVVSLCVGCSQSSKSDRTSTENSTPVESSGAAKSPWGGLEVQFSGAPLEDADQIVILMHGYGATGADLMPLADYLGSESRSFVFPAGPVSLEADRLAWATNEREFEGARSQLMELVEYVAKTYPNAEVSVGGFSQGATLASTLVLEPDVPTDRVILYSPALAFDTGVLNRSIRVFLSHGRSDQVLPFSDAETLRNTLRSQEVPVDWHPFEGGHTIAAETLDATARFLDSPFNETR